MANETTEIIMILDKSGSMTKLKDEVVSGFNDFVNEQQHLGKTLITTVLFNHRHMVLWHQIPAEETVMSLNDYQPGGMTALLDALGATLEHTKQRLASMSEEEIPWKVIVVIITDGMDNASKTYNYESAGDLIQTQQEAGWEFVFLGSNLEIGREAYKLKIKHADAYYYASTKQDISEMFRTATIATTAKRQQDAQEPTEKASPDPNEEEKEIPTLKLPRENTKTTYQKYMKKMHDIRKRKELQESFDQFFRVIQVLQGQIEDEKRRKNK